MRNVVAAPFEEPAADEREQQQNRRHARHDRSAEAVPESRVGLARREPHHHRQHHQRQDVGDDRAAYGNSHSPVPRDAQPAHDGVGDKRLRREKSRQQDGRVERIP